MKKKKYHTVETVPKSREKIPHCRNSPKIQQRKITKSIHESGWYITIKVWGIYNCLWGLQLSKKRKPRTYKMFHLFVIMTKADFDWIFKCHRVSKYKFSFTNIKSLTVWKFLSTMISETNLEINSPRHVQLSIKINEWFNFLPFVFILPW